MIVGVFGDAVVGVAHFVLIEQQKQQQQRGSSTTA